MNTEANRTLVLECADRVAARMRTNRALVLTESDLKCQFFMELTQVPQFSAISETSNPGIRSSVVHSETKFFDEQNLLKQAPDLVLLDPKDLSILHRLDGKPLPSKRFHFDGSVILIELKFFREDIRPTSRTMREVAKDFDKGEMLTRRGLDFHLFVFVFDRFESGEERVRRLFIERVQQRNVTAHYFSGGASFSRRS
jgi:hypothetical protein